MSRGERSTAQRTPLKAAAAATHTGKIDTGARARVEILAGGGGFLLVSRFFFILFLFLFFLRFFEDKE